MATVSAATTVAVLAGPASAAPATQPQHQQLPAMCVLAATAGRSAGGESLNLYAIEHETVPAIVLLWTGRCGAFTLPIRWLNYINEGNWAEKMPNGIRLFSPQIPPLPPSR